MSKATSEHDKRLPDFCLACGEGYLNSRPCKCPSCGATPESLKKFLNGQDSPEGEK